MRVLIISGVGIEFPLGAGALFGEIVGSAWRTVATTAWLNGRRDRGPVIPALRHRRACHRPGCGDGALTAEMCSEQFFETLAVHGARSLSTSGCAPSTNAITAAEKR
jgi:hypothetical protein